MRNGVKFTIDMALWAVAFSLANSLKEDGLAETLSRATLLYLFAGLTVQAGIEWYYRLYRQNWGRISMRDLTVLASAVGVSTLLLFALAFVLQPYIRIARSLPILEGLVALVLLGGVRLCTRLWHERQKRASYGARARRVLIVGAGEAGSMIAREMARHPEAGLQPIGFLDDRYKKHRQLIVGLPVLGRVQDLVSVARQMEAQEVLIAAPSAAGAFVRMVVDLAREAQVSYRIMPGVFEILSGQVSITQIREVNVEDLLRRAPVHLNTEAIIDYVRGRCVMVTGAGGSIGSEIVRQVARFGPSRIILFGRGENSIFGIQQELIMDWPEIEHIALIGDVRDWARLNVVFRGERPDVVFHAAAHKHVPLMEVSPSEAVFNNIHGTANVAEMCLKYTVSRLVNISTDKAVNPTSVMGASKRVAEIVIAGAARRAKAEQAFVSVRFGNVLGSRGSVVPTFMAQIRAGGPVTVTHPDMRRYFMTIPEAARLVLQAGGLAQNGNVYVLNMGDPVRIQDLARDVIRLSGAQNIEIVYSGVRPGEKLYEELLTTSENVDATAHSEISTARLAEVDPDWIGQQVADLVQLAQQNDADALLRRLKHVIPENKFGRLT